MRVYSTVLYTHTRIISTVVCTYYHCVVHTYKNNIDCCLYLYNTVLYTDTRIISTVVCTYEQT